MDYEEQDQSLKASRSFLGKCSILSPTRRGEYSSAREYSMSWASVASENEVKQTKKPQRALAITDDWKALEVLSSPFLDLKAVQFPNLYAAPYGRQGDTGMNLAVDIVSLATNTIRKEAHDFFRLVESCAAHSVHVQHDTINDIYEHLDTAIEISMLAIDAIFRHMMPSAEKHRELKGSLRRGQREALHHRADQVADVMMTSETEFIRHRPAAEQLMIVVKAATGFQFHLDIAALADRHLPLRLGNLSRQELRECERIVLVGLTKIGGSNNFVNEVRAEEATARTMAWMNESQRTMFRRKLWFAFGNKARRIAGFVASDSTSAIEARIEEEVTSDMISSLFTTAESLPTGEVPTENVYEEREGE